MHTRELHVTIQVDHGASGLRAEATPRDDGQPLTGVGLAGSPRRTHAFAAREEPGGGPGAARPRRPAGRPGAAGASVRARRERAPGGPPRLPAAAFPLQRWPTYPDSGMRRSRCGAAGSGWWRDSDYEGDQQVDLVRRRLRPSSTSTFCSLTRAAVTPRRVCEARSTPSRIASSKLVSDLAEISVTRCDPPSPLSFVPSWCRTRGQGFSRGLHCRWGASSDGDGLRRATIRMSPRQGVRPRAPHLWRRSRGPTGQFGAAADHAVEATVPRRGQTSCPAEVFDLSSGHMDRGRG